MFIKSVHVVDDEEGVIRNIGNSIVWLQVFNQSEHPRVGDALYFSLVSGQFFFRRQIPIDGEFKRVVVIPPRFGTGKVPDNVIETGSQVVDNLARQHTESLRDLQVSMIVNSFLPSLFIGLWNDWVFASLKEPYNLIMKVDDVLVGTF
jgi:hypothetical protein